MGETKSSRYPWDFLFDSIQRNVPEAADQTKKKVRRLAEGDGCLDGGRGNMK